MSEFYLYGDTLVPNTVARSVDLKAEFEAIEAGLDKLPTEAQIKLGTAQYGTDAGSANTYVVTLPYTPAAYTAGMVVRFKAAASNTGASTVNVSGKGVKNIKRPDGAALHADDISASGITTLVYDGTNFIVTDALVGVVDEAAAQVALAAAQVALAQTARTGAETAETNAGVVLASTQTVYDNFDDRYLGAKASDPTLDNDGNALVTGALYWNTAAGEMRAWNGSAFVTAYNTVTAASQAEMETGTESAIRSMSPLRVAQAIAAQSSFVGKGGAVVTDGVTLTATSSAAQAITPTYYDEVVTLPDATTMREGVPAFVIQNKSELFDLRVKDSAGTTLGWIRPLATAVIGLADNSTAAGTWITSGLEKLGVSAGLEVTGLSTVNLNTPIAIALDSNRTLLLATSSNIYAIAHDASTNTYSSATLVAGSSFTLGRAILIDTDKVLVVYHGAVDSIYGVVLTISGTTVTVGTPGSTTIASLSLTYGMLAKLSSTSAALTFSNNTTIVLHAISISGTTVTWSAAPTNIIAHTTSEHSYVLVAVSTSMVVAIYMNSTTLTAKPFSISGTTVTAGTAATVASSSNNYRWTLLGTGRILLIHGSSGNQAQASLVNISGTTASLSTLTLGGSFSAAVTTQTAVVSLDSSKALLAYANSTNQSRFVTLTDTSGTLSAGTELADVYDILESPFYVGRQGDVVTFANGTNSPALFNVTLTTDQPTSVHHAGGFYTVVTGGLTGDGFAVDTSVFLRRTALLRVGQAVYALNTLSNNILHMRYGCGKVESVGRPDRVVGATNRYGCPTEGRDTDYWFFSGVSTAMRLHRLEAVE